jgi:hypothetical protein
LRQHLKLSMQTCPECSEMCKENAHNTTAGAGYVLPLPERDRLLVERPLYRRLCH